MRCNIIAMLALVSFSMAWTFPQKVGIYAMIQKLAQFKTGSMEEQIVYGKLSMFLGDWRNSAKLSSNMASSQYRDALFALLSNVNTVRSDAINDTSGVDNLEYLVGRIRQSYANSLHQFFGQ
ncbi:hypothetical protein GGI25_004392 [Coemansia spiralis]|uniref:Uncharacterized protein n=2 Tax=Coemansia TaxID=4863 RepID=A0A9W8KXG7_9FUNG|nr:hypothetical protein BX070DRAFT_252019 [Coemansia spiralis]KAJ1995343.1 hypothetical protein EDC05_000895 [Coemansia umbellata]KAJ2624830.1 hypothetical protein GGI26_001246 [Coemansia sp. RSA 1358]KAJ2674371.1 hypothetical protein GGI25_004392 [Coemansia spiralis]